MDAPLSNGPGFQDVAWKLDYRTSARNAVDIVDAFYEPLLQRAETYDRVAGYFRSSAIRSAMRGFGSFAKRDGKARFIVGVEMDEADLRILTMEKDDRLVEIVEREIDAILDERSEGDEPTPFELLAWMVWRGTLEIRIAAIKRSKAEDSQFFDGRTLGYAHEKWGVVTDVHGRRMGFSGSLNESRTALEENAENISVFCDWKGYDSALRIDALSRDFDNLWEGGHEVVRVFQIPDAVRMRLIRIAERSPLALRRQPVVETPEGRTAEVGVWRRLAEAPTSGGDPFLGITTAPIVGWPQQEFVARRLIETYPRSTIVADEVGLGKTIEIGLALRTLVLSGRASRIMVVAPATLTRQWQTEMKSKFMLDFHRCHGQRAHLLLDEKERDVVASPAAMFAPSFLVVSSALFSRPEVVDQFLRSPDWDLVVLDEAHYATKKAGEEDPGPENAAAWQQKQGDTNLRHAIRVHAGAKSPAMWLATATPVQVRKQQGYDLMRLTGLGGTFLRSDGTSDAYYRSVMKLKAGTGREEDEILVRSLVREVEILDPTYYDFCMRYYAADYASDLRRWLDGGSFRRIARMPSKRLQMAVVMHAMSPMSRVMLRHGRDLLKAYKKLGILDDRLAERKVAAVGVSMTMAETDAYLMLDGYCQRLKDVLARHALPGEEKKVAGQTNFFLSFLRLRFASSIYAAWRTLGRRKDRVDASLVWLERNRLERTPKRDLADEAKADEYDEDSEGDIAAGIGHLPNRSKTDLKIEKSLLDPLVDHLDAMDPKERSSKDKALFGELEGRHNIPGCQTKQTIVFTRFADTMDHLVSHLRRQLPAVPTATFSGRGGMLFLSHEAGGTNCDRTDVKNAFLDGAISILVCTDAAAEGLNLQVADMLINFDLPWNPAKVEQRIGRIDRIGQKYDKIYVRNMAYAGSAEMDVYDRLLKRLDEAEQIVGSQQISLLPIDASQFLELSDPSVSRARKDKILDDAYKSAVELSAAYKERELDVETMAHVHMAMQAEWRASAPYSLDQTWTALTNSAWLASLGCLLCDGFFVVPANAGIFEMEVAFTIDRSAYAKSSASFASWGDPCFDELMRLMSGRNLVSPVDPTHREAEIRRAHVERRRHWSAADAHVRLMDAVVSQFTTGLDAKASPAAKRNEILQRLGTDDPVKRIRVASRTFGMTLPSVGDSTVKDGWVDVPRQVVEIASEERVE